MCENSTALNIYQERGKLELQHSLDKVNAKYKSWRHPAPTNTTPEGVLRKNFETAKKEFLVKAEMFDQIFLTKTTVVFSEETGTYTLCIV